MMKPNISQKVDKEKLIFYAKALARLSCCRKNSTMPKHTAKLLLPLIVEHFLFGEIMFWKSRRKRELFLLNVNV